MKKTIVSLVLIIPFALNIQGQTKKPTTSQTSLQTKLQASIARGKILYAQHCVSCHQVDGGGVPGLNPPLIKTEYVLGDKKRLINIILKGFNEKVEIEGEVYSNPMPALNYLKDQEIADVLTYIRNNFQNKANAITITEVKASRAAK